MPCVVEEGIWVWIPPTQKTNTCLWSRRWRFKSLSISIEKYNLFQFPFFFLIGMLHYHKSNEKIDKANQCQWSTNKMGTYVGAKSWDRRWLTILVEMTKGWERIKWVFISRSCFDKIINCLLLLKNLQK